MSTAFGSHCHHNDDGSEMEFTAGDTFVMPKGWTGI